MTEQQPIPAEALPQIETPLNRGRAARAWEQVKGKAHYLGLTAVGLLALVLPGDIPNRLPAVPEYFPPADDPHALFLEPIEPRTFIEPKTQRPPVVTYVPPVRTPAPATAPAEASQAPTATPESTPEVFEATKAFVVEDLSLLTGSSMSFTLPLEITKYLGYDPDQTTTLTFLNITQKQVSKEVQRLVDDIENNSNLAIEFAGTDGSVIINAHSFFTGLLNQKELPFHWMVRLAQSNPEVALGSEITLNGFDLDGNDVKRIATVTRIAEVTKKTYEGSFGLLNHIEGSPVYFDPKKLGFEPAHGDSVLYFVACSGEEIADGDRSHRVIIRLEVK